VIVPLGFIGVWMFGYFMDKVVRAGQMSERQSLKRSEIWTTHNVQMDRIEAELSKVRQLLQEQKNGERRGWLSGHCSHPGAGAAACAGPPYARCWLLNAPCTWSLERRKVLTMW